MTTLGDVLAIAAGIVAVAFSAWALLLLMVIVFRTRSIRGRDVIESRPVKTIVVGLASTLLIGGLGVALLSNPLPPLKLAGWALLLGLLSLSFLGTSGLVWLASERIGDLDPGSTAYGSLSRGAAFVVLPTILPILGWFLIAPVILCLGVGVGLKTLRREQLSLPDPV